MTGLGMIYNSVIPTIVEATENYLVLLSPTDISVIAGVSKQWGDWYSTIDFYAVGSNWMAGWVT